MYAAQLSEISPVATRDEVPYGVAVLLDGVTQVPGAAGSGCVDA